MMKTERYGFNEYTVVDSKKGKVADYHFATGSYKIFSYFYPKGYVTEQTRIVIDEIYQPDLLKKLIKYLKKICKNIDIATDD